MSQSLRYIRFRGEGKRRIRKYVTSAFHSFSLLVFPNTPPSFIFNPINTTSTMNDQLIVLCCVLGSGAVVFLGYATTHFFFRQESGENAANAGNEFSQAQYMREVRLRNAEGLAKANGFPKRW